MGEYNIEETCLIHYLSRFYFMNEDNSNSIHNRNTLWQDSKGE